MKSRILLKLFLVFIVIVPTIFSCVSSTESDDSTAPIIHDIRMRIRYDSAYIFPDTILLEDGNIITLNTDPNADTDTLVMNRYMYFKGKFEDEEGLSSYRIALDYYDPLQVTTSSSPDVLYTIRKGYDNIYNQTKSIVFKGITTLPDSLSVVIDAETSQTANKPIREGDYILTVDCVDKANNFAEPRTRKIKLLRRQTIIDSRMQ